MRSALFFGAGLSLVFVLPVRAQTVTFTDIVSTKSSPLQQFSSPAINAAGVVVFEATTRKTGEQGIYSAVSLAAFTPIALDTNGEYESLIEAPPVINNKGKVAFVAKRKKTVGAGVGIYTTLNAHSIVPVAFAQLGGTGFDHFGGVSLNDAGTIVFQAQRLTRINGGIDREQGIYAASDPGSFKTIVLSTNSRFEAFNNSTSMNHAGVVAFGAVRKAGGEGIYVAANPASF